MAKGFEVLTMLIPDGGWYIQGNEFEGIEFIDCAPITKAEFIAGFAKYDAWQIEKETKAIADKETLLKKLGITAEEAALLLG